MPRLFIGIPLPESYHRAVAACIATLASKTASKIAWTKPGNAHVTLKFLGQVDTEAIGPIADVLSGLRFPAFTMQAGGYGCFPNEIRARAAWVGIDAGAEPCADLAMVIEKALTPLGFGTMKRPLTPHITLGRIKKNGPDDWGTLLTSMQSAWEPFAVTEFILWESRLTPERAVYSPLGRFPLDG